MKKLYSLLLTVTAVPAFSFSQNLVPNAEFETYTTCPSSLDQLVFCTGWSAYRGTPDYFHSCSFSMFADTPDNFFGYQVPATGQAYASFYAYNTTFFYREFIGRALSSPLVPGTKYYLSMKVALANEFDYSIGCSNIGMKFTNYSGYWYSNPAPVDNSAHLVSTTIITDTANWTTISGSFVADSAYPYIILGNFFDDSNIVTSSVSGQICAYYFVDDICVSTDSAYCYYYTGINEAETNTGFSVSPNPTAGKVKINTGSSLPYTLTVTNVAGEIILRQKFEKGLTEIDLSFLENGIYFISAEKPKEQVYFSKLILLK